MEIFKYTASPFIRYEWHWDTSLYFEEEFLSIINFVQQDTWRNGYRRWFPKLLKETIIWRLQVQSSLQASNNTGIINTCIQLWLMESEQATLVNSIKDVVRSSVKVPEFDKHPKKARGHINRNVEITIMMKTIVRKPLIIIFTYDVHVVFCCLTSRVTKCFYPKPDILIRFGFFV